MLSECAPLATLTTERKGFPELEYRKVCIVVSVPDEASDIALCSRAVTVAGPQMRSNVFPCVSSLEYWTKSMHSGEMSSRR
eukprot:3860931-Rhodomonas_salina.1